MISTVRQESKSPSIEIHQRDIWIKVNNPTKELSQDLFRAFREHKIDQAKQLAITQNSFSEDDIESLQGIEMDVIRKDYSEHKKFIEKTERTYGQALWIKNPSIPYHYDFRWIASNEALMHHLGKKTRFIDIFNYLSDKVDSGGEDLFPERFTETGKAWPYAIVKVNAAFYEEMSRKLSLHEKSITRNTLQQYLTAFCKLGILRQLQIGGGQTGKDSLYAIGYWTPYEGIYRVHYFLKKSHPGIERLMKFSAF